ncbi:MAG: hypothetical protein ACSHYF_12990 [Verrucomicrobiaceae bacterium]
MRLEKLSMCRALGLILLWGCFLQVAQGQGLSREVAAKLIAEAEQAVEREITVGPIHPVERKLAEGTVATEAMCVAFLSPKVVGQTRRRVVSYRTFYHDREWGWYLYAVREIRGGEVIEVVSETKGCFELK